MVFTVVATALSLWKFAADRNNYEFITRPELFLSVPQRSIPHTVSNTTVGLFVLILGLTAVVQLILLAVTQLGRHPAVIPIVAEVVLWIGFGLSSYEMTKGYDAAFACSYPHCTVTYPSVIPYLIVGIVTGVVLGAAWRVAHQHDKRGLSSADLVASVPNLAE
jgi:hypothetical protein